MAKTKLTARKTNTPGMSTYQDDSTSSSSSGEEVDTDVEESRQKGDKPRYKRPIFTRGEGKVTQAPEGGQIKCKVILEYSYNEVSESQLDQISPEYPTVADVAKIKKMKKNMKLTIPRHPTVEGLTESFITWYKDHGMTTSLRKALEANRWTEQMIHEFKRAYIRKYKILQDYAMRYPDEKLSDEDELEEGGLANFVGPWREQHLKDSKKGADGSTLERTTKKKKAKKTSPLDPPGEGEKKAVKCKKGQGNEPGSVTFKAPPEKKQKGESKKKKKRKVETDAAGPMPKKKKAKGTPSAALRRVPDAELLPVPEVPTGAAPVAMEQRPSMDKQLEAHLLSTDPPATVAQQSQTAPSSMAPQVPDMVGFLARLRKSIPRARVQQVLMATPVPRWPKQSWIPVPMAEAQTTKPPTVRELLARKAAGETPKEPTPEVLQPTALRSPPGKGSFRYGDWRTGAHHHGCGNAGGTDGALKWSDDR